MQKFGVPRLDAPRPPLALQSSCAPKFSFCAATFSLFSPARRALICAGPIESSKVESFPIQVPGTAGELPATFCASCLQWPVIRDV
jgi:hypothetical protein